MVSPRLTSLSCSITTLLPGASGQLTSCSWRYRGLSGSSEGKEPFLSPVPNFGTPSRSMSDKPPHCPFLKRILKPIFIPWPSTQLETLLLFSVLMSYCFYCFYCFNIFIILLFFYLFYSICCFLCFMYSTLSQLRLLKALYK